MVYRNTDINLKGSPLTDRIKGSAEQAKGKVKEVAGKMTGDAKLDKAADKSVTPLAASRTGEITFFPQGEPDLPSRLLRKIGGV